MLSKEDIIRTIEDNKEDIKGFGVKKLTLFGSHAKDTADKDSDIDFLVEFEEDRGLFRDFVNLKLFLQDLFGKEVDLVKPELVKNKLRPHIMGGEKVEAEI